MENFKPHIIIAAKMIEAKETQTQLASILGIARQTLCEKLSGKIPFKLKEVKILIDHYNLDPMIFFSD